MWRGFLAGAAVVLCCAAPAGAATIATGTEHSCAVTALGTVQCVGINSAGQLGNGSFTASSTPVTATGVTTATAVAAGGNSTCILLADTTVMCTGGSAAFVPTAVAGLSDVTALALGGDHACALRTDHGIVCWGANASGQLGDGSTTRRSVPTPVSGITTAVAIAAGDSQTCALLDDGTARCWGANAAGQLGNDSVVDSSLPVQVQGITNATSIATKNLETCAVLATGAARCWGSNSSGQLGNDSTTSSRVPVDVSGITTATGIAVGISQACAALADGTARCWGSALRGRLGNGATTPSQKTPVAVTGLSGVRELSIGNDHACAVIGGGAVRCWGYNQWGELGDGVHVNALTAQDTVAPADVTAVAASTLNSPFACGLRSTGAVVCWGDAIGLGSGGGIIVSAPVAAGTIGDATAIGTGTRHACAVRGGGAVSCWGNNNVGQLGNGATGSSLTPVNVLNVTGATAVDGGASHTCALLSDHTVSCWGANAVGQLGRGTTGAGGSTAGAVSGIADATAIAATENSTCALRQGGAVACWGSGDSGVLGNGSTDTATTPVAVTGIANAVSISGGFRHYCAVLADQTVSCWGYNATKQLGHPTPSNSSATPVPADGVTSVAQVAAGATHTCAIRTDGTVRCWGSNNYGELGNGQAVTISDVVTATGVTGATAMTAGNQFTCVTRSGAVPRCWGLNYEGQLADGRAFQQTSPVSSLLTTAAPANRVPVCDATPVTVERDSVARSVGSCSDADGDGITVTVTGNPTHGGVSIVGGRNLAYTPTPGFTGTDSVSYKAADATSESSVTVVTITVVAPNNAPTCTGGPLDVAGASAAVTAGSCSDLDGDAITITITSQPAHGTAFVSGHDVRYAPVTGYRGPDSVSFKAADAKASSTETTATLNVLNAVPQCIGQTLEIDHDTAATEAGSCADVNGDALTITITAPPAHGTATIVGSSVRYAPAAGYGGDDALTFKASDGMADSAPTSVAIHVTPPPNHPPACTGGAIDVAHDATDVAVGSCSDEDGNALTLTITAPPAHGTAKVSGATVRYTPDAGYAGADSVSFKADDGTAFSAPATAELTVAAAPKNGDPKSDAPAQPQQQPQQQLKQQSGPRPATVAVIVAPQKLRADRLGKKNLLLLSGLKPASNVALRVRIKKDTVATFKAVVDANGRSTLTLTLTKKQRKQVTKKVKQLVLRYSYTTEDGVKHVVEPVLKLTR